MGIYDGFDDFDGDFDDYDGGDYEGDSYDDGGFDNDVDHSEDASHDEPCSGGLEWQDWMIIGPMSEEIARERREKRKIEKDISKDKDDYLDIGP